MNIEELKRLTEAATPGPWGYDYDDQDHDTCIGILWGTNHYAIATIPYNGQVSDEKVTATGNYIAAANPAAVLELIRQRDELLAALKEVRDLGHNYTQVSHRVWIIADDAIANTEKQS